MSADDRDALIASARRIGADPFDLATAISYETGGRMSPSIRGGAGNRHIGLIQFGPAEQRQYGASQDQTFQEQLPAVERYLTSRGFKPGMGLFDLYSTINAGRPGLYGASDAGNGGAPGTVADKVRDQMGGHQAKAAAFLGGAFAPQMPGETTRSGRFGLGGVEPSAAPAPAMTMPAPASEAPGLSVADLMKLVAAPAAQIASQPQPDAAPAPQRAAPRPEPARFDPGAFWALLNRR